MKGLGPGQSLSSSLWIRGPEQLGGHSITIYFYYEAPPLSEGSRVHHYRMLKYSFTLKVIPSMSISALRSRPCLHDNNLCQTVLVAVNNASATVTQQVIELTATFEIVSSTIFGTTELSQIEKKTLEALKTEYLERAFNLKVLLRTLHSLKRIFHSIFHNTILFFFRFTSRRLV